MTPELMEQLKERIPHQHCETCGLFHDSEGEWCPVLNPVASRGDA